MILAFSLAAFDDSRMAFKYSPWGGNGISSLALDDAMAVCGTRVLLRTYVRREMFIGFNREMSLACTSVVDPIC